MNLWFSSGNVLHQKRRFASARLGDTGDILSQVFPTPDGQKKRPQGSIRGLRTRSSDYIALRLLLSRLACLRCENRDSYIAFHLPSDGSLAYSAWYMPVKRED